MLCFYIILEKHLHFPLSWWLHTGLEKFIHYNRYRSTFLSSVPGFVGYLFQFRDLLLLKAHRSSSNFLIRNFRDNSKKRRDNVSSELSRKYPSYLENRVISPLCFRVYISQVRDSRRQCAMAMPCTTGGQ